MLACLDCGDSHCTEHEGSIVVTQCPMTHIDRQTSEVLRYAGYARESGLWPVSGGALEQSAAFMAAEAMIRADRAACRAQLGLSGHG